MEKFELVEWIIICLMYGMIVDFSGYISQYGPLYYKVCLNWNFFPSDWNQRLNIVCMEPCLFPLGFMACPLHA